MKAGSLHLKGMDRFFLFGGGPVLVKAAQLLKVRGMKVEVLTSTRLVEETTRSLFSGERLGDLLEKEGIRFRILDDRAQLFDCLEEITPASLGLSFGAPWIFSPDLIAPWKGRLLNLHGAPLPVGRGGGGFTWQILQGSRLGCCLIHQVDAGVDSGPIVKSREFSYPASCRIPRDYFQVLDKKNSVFMAAFLEEIERGKAYSLKPQAEERSVYWPRVSTLLHGHIDWAWSRDEIERFIRAFDEPYPGASSFVNGTRLFLKGCSGTAADGAFHPFQSGLVYRKFDGALFIAAPGGGLVVQSVTDEKGNDLQGMVRVGDRFQTPAAFLEEAKSLRVQYSPKGLKAPR